jgi:demethylmenaquinone methyltransferase/2-methoxy-6-polyprenyl-1,4-benzoquinol methylase
MRPPRYGRAGAFSSELGTGSREENATKKGKSSEFMDRPDQTTHFGFRDVPLGEKQTLVNEVFRSVAQRYDLMNDLMSVGLHRVWKDIMITTLAPPKSDAPFALLDVAGGTGDIAFRAAKAAGAGFRATVCDINGDMLAVGRERAAKRHLDDRVSFVEGNAETLSFADRSFDAYTIAFGIRNVPQIDLALREAYRVLRPGSRFLVLEFSTVDVPGLDRLYDLFSFKVIPPLGRVVTGDAESYQYLVESIRKFPRPSAFAEMISAAGFSRVKWQSLSGGIVALHSGWRL